MSLLLETSDIRTWCHPYNLALYVSFSYVFSYVIYESRIPNRPLPGIVTTLFIFFCLEITQRPFSTKVSNVYKLSCNQRFLLISIFLAISYNLLPGDTNLQKWYCVSESIIIIPTLHRFVQKFWILNLRYKMMNI